MASLAQQESQSLSQNVKLGLQFRYQNGQVQVNHNHFLGYTKDADGNLIIDPEQAEVVKRIYREYLEGYSMDRIAKGLEADGILTGAGKTKWWTSTINKILRNEKYIGDALLQKTYTTDFLNKTRVKNNGIVPQYYVEGNHEAIIPKDIFLRVQEELVRRRVVKTSANGKKRSYSCNHCFAQIVICANVAKCSAESTGTIAAANPSSGAASAGWNRLDRNATPEPSMSRYTLLYELIVNTTPEKILYHSVTVLILWRQEQDFRFIFLGSRGGFQSTIVCPVRISTASTKSYSLTLIR